MTRLTKVLSQHRAVKQGTGSTVCAGYDEVNDELIVLSLSGDGAIYTVPVIDDLERLIGLASTAVKDQIEDMLNFTATAEMVVSKILFTGNGVGEFRVYVNGSRWVTLRNSYFHPSPEFETTIRLSPGDVLKVEVVSATIVSEANDYETYIYYKEL